MNFSGSKKETKKAGILRRSQVVTTFGCGSIVDLPGWSVIISGLDYWTDDEDERIYEDSLQNLLGVKYFLTPPENVTDKGQKNSKGIKSFLFPQWLYCPQCKRLARYTTFNFTDKPKCTICKQSLVPSRFVVACENGHLEDFPYERWVHSGENCQKGRAELYISMSEKSAGLESIIIECKACDKKRSMAGSFGIDSMKGVAKCHGNRPWLRDKEPGACDKPLRTLQRGATNLHINITASALSIPPWSEKIQTEIGKASNWSKISPFIDNKSVFLTLVETWGWPKTLNCTAEDIYNQAKLKKENSESGNKKSWKSIQEEEYCAFNIGCEREDGQFKTKEVEIPKILEGYVEKVVLGLRLREVMALCGFKRLNFEYDIDDNQTFTRLGRDFSEWLPAVELKGEGIFIKLNLEKLKHWESNPDVKRRYQKIVSSENYLMSRGPGSSCRYILLHTLSHLLIRQLNLQCGYSSSAIKERIYCTFVNEDTAKDMCGILIYTATNDSEGSLGGLVREGEPDRLDSTFRNIFESASWCSADPLCIQATGQGLNATNLAACFSCALLPETSCERRNCFLDRAALIGTLDNRDIGYFGALVHQDFPLNH